MTHDSTQLPDALRAHLRRDPLWEFALALYGRDGVEAACLTLQDEAGIDVCEMLWHCWLYQHGLTCDAPPDAVRRWQHEVTAPLRRLRRALKAEARDDDGVAELRRTLQTAELQAEREALSRLQRLALSGRGIHRLSTPPPEPVGVLAGRLHLHRAPHLIKLKMLISQLDPS
ncbi:TIGR02444 family protein [Halomonas sp. CS7]|uniref:TIGR02444 family protein n=1 Tax=Halomonas pelophila TaxID=3151122 RepID=A0ABV1N7A7_9GAMM